jgi:hypothetical protein
MSLVLVVIVSGLVAFAKEFIPTSEMVKVLKQPDLTDLETRIRIFEEKDLYLPTNNSVTIDLKVIHLDQQWYPYCTIQ